MLLSVWSPSRASIRGIINSLVFEHRPPTKDGKARLVPHPIAANLVQNLLDAVLELELCDFDSDSDSWRSYLSLYVTFE